VRQLPGDGVTGNAFAAAAAAPLIGPEDPASEHGSGARLHWPATQNALAAADEDVRRGRCHGELNHPGVPEAPYCERKMERREVSRELPAGAV